MEIKDFHAIRISLASPDEMRSWSHGEVTKPETINYRRLRPEKDGLFCEAIFGPTKDWQCYCGKYKKIRYRGIVCDKCGVEVTRARVRRERMGHIDLASPVAHIWYTRRVPSYLGILLDISRRNLDRVLYFAQYVVTGVDEEARKREVKHLEEELREAVAAARGQDAKDPSAERAQVEEALAGLKADLDEKRVDANASLEKASGDLMQAAAEMQQRLNELRDEVPEEDVLFEATGAVIAQAGEAVDAEAHERLNEVLQARLSDLQMEAEEAVSEEQARYQTERAKLEKELAAEPEEGADDDESVAALEEAYRASRDELENLTVMQLLTEAEYWDLKDRFGSVFSAGMGADAVFEIVSKLDLTTLAREMRTEIATGRSKQRRKKSTKRLKVIEALRRSNNRPEWMILQVLPVIPPDLRPMVQLDGGRFATSDLNDLYRRVINRNNRLKRLLELGAPDVIIRNEKRMLQEAVDSLIDNSRRGKAVSARGRRKLKSLSDMLKGKQGRFRRNLLGKRVDYSGRSVIVIGPQLKLHQCGLPKTMALELFRPFVMRKLVEYNFAHNVKGAKRLIEKMDPVVWEVLEEIIQDYPVLLNRAPTLHRLGIQAFQPILVEGKAIQIHPLVCSAFNADFDGDMMAVHVPLSEKAKREARELMLASNNLLKPSSGEPIVEPTKDMVLGMYYLTVERDGVLGSGTAYTSVEDVELAYDMGLIHIHAPITLYTTTYYGEDGKRVPDEVPIERTIQTTAGRAIFNRQLPDGVRYWDVGIPLGKGEVKDLVAEIYEHVGPEFTAEAVDRMKSIGFQFATRSGLSIAVDDLVIPGQKTAVIAEADEVVLELNRNYRRGLITDDERYMRTVEVWNRVTDVLTDAVRDELPEFGAIRMMAASGSTKGGFSPIRQLAGMRGLMSDPSGRIIDLPIRSNFREGLSSLEYFISTHGARKGLADTALRTADAGYLTRRLVDVAQDAVINDHDCGTTHGLLLDARMDPVMPDPMHVRVAGRAALLPIVDPKTGEVLVEAGTLLESHVVDMLAESNATEAWIRSPLGCRLRHGICQLCYGQDLARGGLINIGEAVGIIAAQSIGEPGTQLTLRTFHTGGVATSSDITQGLPRVQELFEARNPRGEAILADIAGRVTLAQEGELQTLTITDAEIITDSYPIAKGWKAVIEAGDRVKRGDVLARDGKGEGEDEIVAEHAGVADITKKEVLVRHDERREEEYVVPAGARLLVSDGDDVIAGAQMTEGAQNPYRILDILGIKATQQYLLDEIQHVYRSQGVTINDKHVEIIVRQMLGKVQVMRPGDSKLLPGDLIDRSAIEEINVDLVEREDKPATYQPVLLGITKASLSTESLLSAASFQHTINVLAKAAIEGKTDRLVGLKENVIIGKLIPAGTGFRRRVETIVNGSEPDDDVGGLDLSDEVLAELIGEDLELERLSIDEAEDPVTASKNAALETGEESDLDVDEDEDRVKVDDDEDADDDDSDDDLDDDDDDDLEADDLDDLEIDDQDVDVDDDDVVDDDDDDEDEDLDVDLDEDAKDDDDAEEDDEDE